MAMTFLRKKQEGYVHIVDTDTDIQGHRYIYKCIYIL